MNIVQVDSVGTVDGVNSAALDTFRIVPVTHAYEGVQVGVVPYQSWADGDDTSVQVLVPHESEFELEKPEVAVPAMFVSDDVPNAVRMVSVEETFLDAEDFDRMVISDTL